MDGKKPNWSRTDNQNIAYHGFFVALVLKNVMDYQSTTEMETTRIASDYAKNLAAGDIVALYGALGAGKSVFCRSIIRTLCSDSGLVVPSPTFSLLQTYEAGSLEIYHYDLYRLNNPEEIYELGWEDACAGPIVLIEWPQRIEPLLPPRTRKILFEDDENNGRYIRMTDGN
jgi:tRNA threonylcarbamoyl adenosine modification protein YjeE